MSIRFEYRGENQWLPLSGTSLTNFVRATGAQTGPGLPQITWQFLPFYDFTALIRLPDAVGGASEWYLTNGGRFWPMDKFGVAISAMNETAPLRLTRATVPAYFRFWASFTAFPSRIVVLNVAEPELADEAAGEVDPMLRPVVVEGQDPTGWLLSATVFTGKEIQRRLFRVSAEGQVELLDQVSAKLPTAAPLAANDLRRAG